MITRFELFIVLRIQVSDRVEVRHALAIESVMEELCPLANIDVALGVLAALGTGLDAQLCRNNPGRRGEVAREMLLTEGVPGEAAQAVEDFHRLELDQMTPLAAALVGAEGLALGIKESLDVDETTLDELEPRLVAMWLRNRAERRADPDAQRVLAALSRIGVDLDAAAKCAIVGMLRAREDLRL